MDSVAIPPRKPQRTMLKRTCVTVHDHFWLYLEPRCAQQTNGSSAWHTQGAELRSRVARPSLLIVRVLRRIVRQLFNDLDLLPDLGFDLFEQLRVCGAR